MAYPDRLATLNATAPTISLTMAQLAIPALPENQNNNPLPHWLDSKIGLGVPGAEAQFNNGDSILWAQAYYNGPPYDTAAGVKVMGVSAGDYAVRVGGVADPDNGYSFFSNNAFHHETYFGLTLISNSNTTPDIQFAQQHLGPLTGGIAASGSFSGVLTGSITLDSADYSDNANPIFSMPAQASALATPSALCAFVSHDASEDQNYRIFAVKIAASAVSLVGLYNLAPQEYNGSIKAAICDGSGVTLVSDIEFAFDDDICLIETSEQAYPATTFAIHHIGFSGDPDLPTYMESLFYGLVPSPDLIGYHISGTPLGWVLSYGDKEGGSSYIPKFLLISRDWTSYQRIIISGDAATAAILAQGTAPLAPEIRINLTNDGAVWSLLGGTVSGPLLVQSPIAEEAACDLDLSDVVKYFAHKVGLDQADIDASDLEGICIEGHKFYQGDVSSDIGPLLDLYDADCRMAGFVLEFIRRDRAPVALIETDVMVRGGADAPLYETWMIPETDVARRLFLTFADPEADFQANTATKQRNLRAVDSVKELTIDMRTTTLGRDEAGQRAEQLLRRFWMGRLQSKFGYSYAEVANECADKINVNFDGEIVTLKIKKLTITAGYVIELELERDHPALALLSNSVGAEAVGHPPSQVLLVGPTKLFILDIPQPFDDYEQSTPYLIVAAGPVDQTSFWGGADVAYSTSGGAEDFLSGWDGVASSEAVTWGVANDALGPALASVIDYASVIEVVVQHGELLSSTEAEVIADRTVNLALIGDELVQFIDAQIIDSVGASATYQLSGFVRAVQGTEWAMEDHLAGEPFVLLDRDEAKKHTVGAIEIGATRYYRGDSVGLGATLGDVQSRYFTDAAQRPLSPENLNVQYNGETGSFEISWQRRSRINGSLNGSDIPLGETSEEYRVVIQIDSGAEREVLVTSSEFEYTPEMQIEDLGSPAGFIFGTVQQRSPSLGLDGYPASFASDAISS